jgi:ribosome modulation factor
MSIESQLWNNLVSNEIATDAELELVTCINGYSVETLNSVLFTRTNFRSWESYEEANREDVLEDHLQEVWEKGNDAYYDGITRDDNPYDEESQESAFEAWENGWDQADSDCDDEIDQVEEKAWSAV